MPSPWDIPEPLRVQARTQLDLAAEGIKTVIWTTGYRPDYAINYIHTLALQLTSGLNNPYDQATAIETYLRSEAFKYTLTPAQPPKGVLLDSPEQIAANAPKLAETVANRYMPIGNLTQMTDDERAIVAAWFAQGATTK